MEFVTERLFFDPGGEDASATFQLHLLGAVAQLERCLIRERQREGIALARQRGRLVGEGVPKAKIARAWAARAGCSTTP